MRNYLPLRIITALVLIGANLTIAQAPTQAQAIRAKQSEGKQVAGAIVRSQQAYYLENNKFATSFQELGNTSLNRTSPNYKFSITKLGENFTQVNAVPKLSNLKSYVGFVYIEEKNKEAISIASLCESNRPSSTVPKLSITNKKLKCPTGYTDLSRN
jgi:type IV pilus assembly protein PilA